MKDKKMLYGIGVVFLLLATVGFSYAYFTASIANKEVKDQVVETGTLSLRYVDGPEINMQNIKPGQTITKKVTVKNTGTLDVSYNFVWQELNNTITNDEMVISATCKRLNGEVKEESCEGIDEIPIKENIIKKKISIEPGITHEYNVTITFIETNTAQNYNQGKTFGGVLGINEFKVPDPVYCTFDGDMVQGAEYVNGQYTYRYMQEGANVSSELSWNDIATDGWGAQLTDKESTEPVTSKFCTYINNKPVVSTAYMFSNSQATTLDVSNFVTSNVTNMIFMFFNSKTTTLDVSNFDTSKVTNMRSMFSNSAATTLDVNSFDTSNVTDMGGMFQDSQSLTLDLSRFDTSKVTDMDGMFQDSQATTLDLSSFDTSNVTNMSSMFYNIKATTLDVSNFDTSKVTDMASLFEESKVILLDLSSFDTSNVINMGYMFANSKATTIDLSSFDTSNVTRMSNMFRNSNASIIDVSNFDTSNVTDMSLMFYYSNAVTLDVSSFDTSKVTNMRSMFSSCSNLKTIYANNTFDTSNVTAGGNMFINCNSLVGGAGTKYDSARINKTYARIDGGTDSPGYFTLKSN